MSAHVRRPARGHRAVAVAVALALLTLLALPGFAAGAGTAHADTPSPDTLATPDSDDAMLNLLAENGIGYTASTTAADASSYGGPDSTLVVNYDETGLSAHDIAELADERWGRVIILGTDPKVLAAFAPGITAQAAAPGTTSGPIDARCDQADASAAGSVLIPAGTDVFLLPAPSAGSTASPAATTTPAATATPTATSTSSSPIQDVTGCYPVGSPAEPAMVSMRNDQTGGDVILLGWNDFIQNQYLAEQGDAALALGLFGAHGTLVWLARSFTPDENLGPCQGSACGTAGPSANPDPGSGAEGPQGGGSGGSRPPTLSSLVPHWIWWALLQLAIAALALAYWRARRLGRLVNENLPVKVRAAETVEGHANLYRRAAAYERAAGLLRSAAARRIAALLGLPAGPAGRAPATLVGPLAARLGRAPEQVQAILAGEAPMTEAELVELTDQLDRLEQEVRSP